MTEQKMNWKKEMPSDFLKKFNELCVAAYEKKNEIKKQEDDTKLVKAELSSLKVQIISALQENSLKNFRSSDGLVSLMTRKSTTVFDEDAFHQHLKDAGLYETMVSVNAAKRNKYFSTESDLPENKDNLEFGIPGLNSSEYTDLRMNK